MKFKGLVLIISICSLIFSLVISTTSESKYNLLTIGNRFQREFYEREKSLNLLLEQTKTDLLSSGTKILFESRWVEQINQLYDLRGEIIIVVRNDSIIFLSHNALPVSNEAIPTGTGKVIQFPNGWYYFENRQFEDLTIIGFSLIKKEYTYKNQFLISSFFYTYEVPSVVGLSTDSAQNGSSVFDSRGNFLLNLTLEEADMIYEQGWLKSFVILLDLLFLTLFFVYISLIISRIAKSKGRLAAIGFAFVIFLFVRILTFLTKFPISLYSHDIFSASHFASSNWVPSLGDLFFNVILFMWFSFLVYYYARVNYIFKKKRESPVFLFLIFFISFLSIGFLSFATLNIIENLVINSSINFNVKFIFSLDIYHFVGFLTIISLLIIFYFLILTFQKLGVDLLGVINARGLILRWPVYIALCFSTAIFLIVIPYEQILLWLLLYVAGLFIFLRRLLLYKNSETQNKVPFSISDSLIAFFIFSIITTYALYVYNNKKEILFRQNIALRIASEQDPVAEFLFKQLEGDLFSDHILKQVILDNPYDEEAVSNYLKREYFNSFWAKYDIQVTVCSPSDVLFFVPINANYNCMEYFLSYLEQSSRPTLSRNLHYLDNTTGRNSYLAIIPIFNKNEIAEYNVYIEFESRFIPKELGFPELLIDENIDVTKGIGDYSYAIYKNSNLEYKFGSFIYSVDLSAYPISHQETFDYFDSEGYKHLLYNRDRNTTIIVSKQSKTILEKIAPLSYLVIFFLIGVIVLWGFFELKGERVHSLLNFRNRLQVMVLAIVLTSVLVIGSVSAVFILNIYNNKNEKIINEKAHSILIELENRLAREAYLDESYTDYLNQMLMSISQVFFADINLFGVKGELIASSRTQVFEEGLIAKIMNPVALNVMSTKQKGLFIHKEKIGKLEYLSAYVPLRNSNGELLAFINLPYFAQHSELRNEISYFLLAFANIYLLLLLISIVIAFFVSNYVTRPLQIIKSSISSLTISKSNKKIAWSRNDEIGQLINEYNRMIDELEASAELLARSERESAWREMAKQVAHEIKNPLTPMRLNVQYLQKAWKDRVEDWDKRLERFSKAMVEQIDNLSIIASEFSDFAKMPVANNQIIIINDFIGEIPDLYKGLENVKVNIDLQVSGEELPVYADPKQLLRVFNNLIKNAVQAYSKNQTSIIDIVLQKEQDFVKIEVKDYGSGIDEKLKGNIFQPYFTTKTAGMGLGLAMVKSIIDSFNGHIYFESSKNRGTTFTFRLPLYEPNR